MPARLRDSVAPSPKRRADGWYTTASLARELGVSERTIRGWVGKGKLPSYKIGSSRRFKPADVEAFLVQFREEGGKG
jgi:excisionase family DNA binding protein